MPKKSRKKISASPTESAENAPERWELYRETQSWDLADYYRNQIASEGGQARLRFVGARYCVWRKL